MNNRSVTTVQSLLLLLLLSVPIIAAGVSYIHYGQLQDPLNANGQPITNAPGIWAGGNTNAAPLYDTNGAAAAAQTNAESWASTNLATATLATNLAAAAQYNASVTATNQAAAAQSAAEVVATNQAAAAVTSAQATSLQKSANLSDLTNAATARTNLGLGTAATNNATAFLTPSSAASTYVPLVVPSGTTQEVQSGATLTLDAGSTANLNGAVNANRWSIGNATAFMFEGDSITSGYGTASPSTQRFSALCASLPFFLNHGTIYNDAVSGSTIPTGTNSGNNIFDRFTANIYPHRSTAFGGDGGANPWLYLLIGTNDLDPSVLAATAGLQSIQNITITGTFSSGYITVTPPGGSPSGNIGIGTNGTSNYNNYGAQEELGFSSGWLVSGPQNATVNYTFTSTTPGPKGAFTVNTSGLSGSPVVTITQVQVGTNDILNNLQTYIANCHAIGIHVALWTIPPRSYISQQYGTAAGRWNTTSESNREQLNTYVREGLTGADLVLDTESILTNPDDTSYMSPDGLHPNANGNVRMANFLNSSMESYGVVPPAQTPKASILFSATTSQTVTSPTTGFSAAFLPDTNDQIIHITGLSANLATGTETLPLDGASCVGQVVTVANDSAYTITANTVSLSGTTIYGYTAGSALPPGSLTFKKTASATWTCTGQPLSALANTSTTNTFSQTQTFSSATPFTLTSNGANIPFGSGVHSISIGPDMTIGDGSSNYLDLSLNYDLSVGRAIKGGTLMTNKTTSPCYFGANNENETIYFTGSASSVQIGLYAASASGQTCTFITTTAIPTLTFTGTSFIGVQPTSLNAGDSITWRAESTVGSGAIWVCLGTIHNNGAIVLTSAPSSSQANTRVIANGATSLAIPLPTSAAVGDTFEVTGAHAGNGFTLAQAAGQVAYWNGSGTTTGTSGYIASANSDSCVKLECTVANTTWEVTDNVGTITLH